MNILLYESNSTSKHIKHIIAHKKKVEKLLLEKQCMSQLKQSSNFKDSIDFFSPLVRIAFIELCFRNLTSFTTGTYLWSNPRTHTMGYAFWGDKITQVFVLLLFSHHPDFSIVFIPLYYMHLCKPPHVLCGMRQGTNN